MASSRLYKLGSIFDRVNGLIETKIMLERNIPMWYDIYKRYPPKLNPAYEQPVEMVPIKPIFYPEDNLRVKIHASVPNIIIDLNEKSMENFTNNCQKLMNQGFSMDKAIQDTSHVVFKHMKLDNTEDKEVYIIQENEDSERSDVE